MVGIVIISHGQLSYGFKDTLDMFYYNEKQVTDLAVGYDTNIDEFKNNLSDKIKEVDSGEGVLILADLLGGSPCGATYGFLSDKVDVITGINFPMLLAAITYRKNVNDHKELIRLIVDEATKGIMHLNEKMEGLK